MRNLNFCSRKRRSQFCLRNATPKDWCLDNLFLRLLKVLSYSLFLAGLILRCFWRMKSAQRVGHCASHPCGVNCPAFTPFGRFAFPKLSMTYLPFVINRCFRHEEIPPEDIHEALRTRSSFVSACLNYLHEFRDLNETYINTRKKSKISQAKATWNWKKRTN